MPKLMVEVGKQIGAEFDVADRMVLGRAGTTALDDDQASREHAVIRFVKGRYYVIDLGSKNGTLVNDARVKQAPLVPGDRVKIGETTLLFYDEEHPLRPTDTLGADELKRATDEADAIETGSQPATDSREDSAEDSRADTDHDDEESSEERPGAPLPRVKAAAADPSQTDAIEAALFALLLVLVFLNASYATQVLLRLAT